MKGETLTDRGKEINTGGKVIECVLPFYGCSVKFSDQPLSEWHRDLERFGFCDTLSFTADLEDKNVF